MSDQYDAPQGAQPGEPDRLGSGPAVERVTGGSAGASTGGRRGRVALAAVAVVGIGALGAGAWAVTTFLASDAQPAEALPADTLLYASVDLDPGGEQKIEALRMADKFPALRKELGLSEDDDLRRVLLDKLGEEPGCDLDFDEVEPWLGSQAAVAAVPGEEEAEPEGVVVVAITDRDEAAADEDALRACAGTDDAGFALTDEWLVLAGSQQVADDVASGDGDTLAGDADFEKWTGEVGDLGILNAYAAPEAGRMLGDAIGSSASGEGGWFSYGDESPGADPMPEEAMTALRDFGGAAFTVRFADGTVEAEAASDNATAADFLGSAGAADLVAGLPDDTAAALGISFADGWAGALTEQFSEAAANDEMNDLLANVADQFEGALGDSAVLSVGAGMDPDQLGSADADLPVGLTVQGDADTIESSIDELLGLVPQEVQPLLVTESEGDKVALSPDADYRDALLNGSGDTLGDSETFRSVVPEAADAQALAYVDFDALQSWLPELVGGDEADEDLAPLRALGVSAAQDGDVSRVTLRLATD